MPMADVCIWIWDIVVSVECASEPDQSDSASVSVLRRGSFLEMALSKYSADQLRHKTGNQQKIFINRIRINF